LQIHERTQIPITRIRTTLNVLHKFNIVSYNSSRDEEKGWFKYTWELREECIEPSIKNFLISKMMKLKRDFQEINQADFFKCENGCLRVGFTEAYDLNFRCDKCSAQLKPVDSLDESKQIQRELDNIKSIIESLGPLPMSLKNVG
jgi:transcription initiation factor TFIIE subunit alpha